MFFFLRSYALSDKSFCVLTGTARCDTLFLKVQWVGVGGVALNFVLFLKKTTVTGQQKIQGGTFFSRVYTTDYGLLFLLIQLASFVNIHVLF